MKTKGQVDWFSLQIIVLVLLAVIVAIVALSYLPYLNSALDRILEELTRCCL